MYEFQNPHTLWNSIDKQLPNSIPNQREDEACLISIFAIGYQLLTKANTCEVRLVKDNEPIEAEIKTEKESLGFQITMLLRDGRKLKDELLGKIKFQLEPPVSFEKYAELIKKTIAKKEEKYGSRKGVNLLIYALIGTEYLFSGKITKYFSNFVTSFASIWMMIPIYTSIERGIWNGYLIIKISPNPTFYDHLVFADDGIGYHRPPSKYGAIP